MSYITRKWNVPVGIYSWDTNLVSKPNPPKMTSAKALLFTMTTLPLTKGATKLGAGRHGFL